MTAARLQPPLPALAATLAALALLTAAPAHAQEEPSGPPKPTPGVKRLWQEYPLNPERDSGASPPPSQPADAPPATSERFTADEGDSSTGALAVVLLLVGFAVLAAVAVPVLLLHARPALAVRKGALFDNPGLYHGGPRAALQRVRLPNLRREGGAPMGHLVRRLLGSSGADERKDAVRPPGDGEAHTRADLLAAYSLQARSDAMSNEPEPSEPEAPEPNEAGSPQPVEPAAGQDLAQVGEQVTAVLSSAQRAADEIIASARGEAARVRSEAQEIAEAAKVEAASEAASAREESDRLRKDANAYSMETRAAADEYAAGARAEAEAEAARTLAEAADRGTEIRAEAEQRVRELERQELLRQEALVRDAERFEERLDSLVEVFRGMTGQLEDVIRANRNAKRAEARSEAEAVDSTPDPEALDEALRPEHAQPRSTTASDAPTAKGRRS